MEKGILDELLAYNATPKPEKTGQTVEEKNLEIAVRNFVDAERQFKKLNDHPLNASNSAVNLRWWNAMQHVYECDIALWHLFCGPDKSPRSNAEYAKFRLKLLNGVPQRADA